MRWTAPPTRREITLVLFSLSVFILSYNLDSSLRFLGFDPVYSEGSFLSSAGLKSTSVIGPDGRKPRGWRDKLERQIFGDWRWDVGHIAGDGTERSQRKGTGRYGAQWISRDETGPVDGDIFGNDKAHDVVSWWGNNVPTARLVKHIPGFTIIDSAIMYSGSMYLVTENPESFPPPDQIASWSTQSHDPAQTTDWHIINRMRGRHVLGAFGGKIRGVTFMSTDVATHNATLYSLWRFYNSLSPTAPFTLPPPRRIFLPHFSQFLGIWDESIQNGVRIRSEPGWHKKTAKVAFPSMGVMYEEDWGDYTGMEVPFVLERIVISDRLTSTRNNGGGALAPFLDDDVEGGKQWLDPVRQALHTYFEVGEKKAKDKVVVTYVSRQSAGDGPRLRDADHQTLVNALKNLGRGFEVHIVDELADDWDMKMKAIARSSIMLGTPHTMFDSVFMKPPPSDIKAVKPTVIELWPQGSWEPDVQVIIGSLEYEYVAFWGDRKFTPTSLPPPSLLPPMIAQEISIHAPSIIEAIKDAPRNS